jgi:hypothetical protein
MAYLWGAGALAVAALDGDHFDRAAPGKQNSFNACALFERAHATDFHLIEERLDWQKMI